MKGAKLSGACCDSMLQPSARTGASAKRTEANDNTVGKPLRGLGLLGACLRTDYRHRRKNVRHISPARAAWPSLTSRRNRPQWSGRIRAGDLLSVLQTTARLRRAAAGRERSRNASMKLIYCTGASGGANHKTAPMPQGTTDASCAAGSPTARAHAPHTQTQVDHRAI